MFRVILFTTAVIAAMIPSRGGFGSLSSSLGDSNISFTNSSLFENFAGIPALAIPGFLDTLPLEGGSPDQWRVAELFKKRQEVCTNYCGSDTPKQSYCTCGRQCCGQACCATASGYTCCGDQGCCNTATGAVCCGASCCINGATCGDGKCKFQS
jgi:hypothetical protein